MEVSRDMKNCPSESLDSDKEMAGMDRADMSLVVPVYAKAYAP